MTTPYDPELEHFKRSIDLAEYAKKAGYEPSPMDAGLGVRLTLLDHPSGDRVAVAQSTPRFRATSRAPPASRRTMRSRVYARPSSARPTRGPSWSSCSVARAKRARATFLSSVCESIFASFARRSAPSASTVRGFRPLLQVLATSARSNRASGRKLTPTSRRGQGPRQMPTLS